jgi:hypothetical protein
LNSSAKHKKYFKDKKAVHFISCYITSVYVRNFQVSVETCTRSGWRDLSRQLQRTKWRIPYTTNRKVHMTFTIQLCNGQQGVDRFIGSTRQ